MSDETERVEVEAICAVCKRHIQPGETISWLGETGMTHVPTCPIIGKPEIVRLTDEQFLALPLARQKEAFAELMVAIANEALTAIHQIASRYGNRVPETLGATFGTVLDVIAGKVMEGGDGSEKAKYVIRLGNATTDILSKRARDDGKKVLVINIEPDSVIPSGPRPVPPDDRPTREPGANVHRMPRTRR